MATLQLDGDRLRATWERYLRARSVTDRDALVTHYVPLAGACARRMVKRFPARVPYDELRCAALAGMWRAVESFDPSRAARFETYCRRRVTGAVIDWVRSVDPQSRVVRGFERRRSRAAERLRQAYERWPSDVELAVEMELSPTRFARLARRVRIGSPLVFSALAHRAGGDARGSANERGGGDPRSEDPARRVTRRFLVEKLTRGFSRDEQRVVILYYFAGRTMSEVGAKLGLSEARISQIHRDVLQRMRGGSAQLLRHHLAE